MKTRTTAVIFFGAIALSVISYTVGFRQGQRAQPATAVASVAAQKQVVPMQLTNPRQLLTGAQNFSVSYDMNSETRRRSFRRQTTSATAVINLVPQERAEVFDAGAMNDYRNRWERQTRNPGEAREPLFNPSATERLWVP